MAEDIFSEEYKLKRKEFKEICSQKEVVQNDMLKEFFKCIRLNYVEDLKTVINSIGTENHKTKYKTFYEHFNSGQVEDSDIEFFEIIKEIYENELPKRNENAIEFYKKIPLSFVKKLMEIIESYGVENHKIQFKDFYNKYQSNKLMGNDIKLFFQMEEIYKSKIPNIK